jgi:DNA invertase Pin-like site-specific DNA recombinase
MKAALYARVSTRDKGQNPDLQLQALREFSRRMSWEITREYVDQAPATRLDLRIQWAAMMKAAAVRKFDILLIWKLDRAFRSMVHAANTLQMLRSYGVVLRSYMDPGIDSGGPNGDFMFNIMAAAAQFEKDLDAVRIQEGIDFAKEHGTKSGRPIGRKPRAVSLQTICKAVRDARGNYSEAARSLTEELGEKIEPGLVSIRISRAGLTKEKVLEGF